MRKLLYITSFVTLFSAHVACADEYESYEVINGQDGSVIYSYDSDGDYTGVDYRQPREYVPQARRAARESAGNTDALSQARYETQLMREYAQQETYRQRIASGENSRRIAENSREIQENQRRYENNSNTINNVNQAANAATNVARQAKTIGTLMNGGWDAYKDAWRW